MLRGRRAPGSPPARSSTRAATALIDGTFDLICRGGTAWRAGSGRPDGPLFSRSARASPRAPWTAALFRAELFRKVGLLEESFESYLEDVDFGLRCAAQRISGRYVPEAVAWHRGSATLGRWHPETVRRIARNQICCWPRAIIPRAILLVADPGGAGACGAASRCGMARARVAARQVSKGCARFRSRAPKASRLRSRTARTICATMNETIRELQTATGFDTYWRLYFLLTGGGAK